MSCHSDHSRCHSTNKSTRDLRKTYSFSLEQEIRDHYYISILDHFETLIHLLSARSKKSLLLISRPLFARRSLLSP